MVPRVTWKTNPELSVLHAAAVVASGAPVADPALEAVLADPVAAINLRLSMAELDLARFWETLITAALNERQSDAERVEQSLRAAGCSDWGLESLAEVSGRLADARILFAARLPKLAEQLPLRARPLRELWDAFGPGLLREIGAATHNDLLPKRATVHLVQPVRGGDGGAAPEQQSVWLEAVLTNADPAVPEVVRLAWLIARLGLGRAGANRLVLSERLPRVAALALVPAALHAGQQIEQIGPGALPIAKAMESWHLGEEEAVAEKLDGWWQQTHAGTVPFPVAVKALDKMLG